MKRILSERQRSWLAGELDSWKSQSIVTQEQASKILGLYETSADESHRKQSVLLSTLMGLAALMVGLAVFLLIGYNWDDIPKAGKLTLIMGTIAATYGGAWVAHKRDASKWIVDVILFLGALFYGGAIFLIAQIFHLNAHYPNAFWWWAIGVMPFALARRNLLLHALYAWLLALWCGMEVIGFNNLGMWWFWGRWGTLPNGAYSMLLLAAPGLLAGYRNRSAATVALYVVALTWWLVIQPVSWDMEFEMIYFIGSVGALLVALGEAQGERTVFARPYRFLGTILAAGVLSILSYHAVNLEIFKRGSIDRPEAIFEAVAIGVLAIIALLPSTGRFFARLAGSGSQRETLKDNLLRSLLPVVLTLVFLISLVWQLTVHEAVVPTILANVGMLALAAHLIRTGLSEDRALPFTVGVLYFLLWTILRYVDLFGDFGGMLGAALMFLICGAVLYGVARYWQGRKRGTHG